MCFAANRLKITPSQSRSNNSTRLWCWPFWSIWRKTARTAPEHAIRDWPPSRPSSSFWSTGCRPVLNKPNGLRAIPVKKTDEVIVGYLNREEIQALLDAPDPNHPVWVAGSRHVHLAFAGGLRVSELVGLNLADLTLHTQPCVHVMGKGRRERILPLWKETASALRDWLKARGEPKGTALFQNARGELMTRSGFKYILTKYVRTASVRQPSLVKKRVSPHSLRHACAMHTLHATGDIRKVALWLGHASLQSTEVYFRADPAEKLRRWHRWFRRLFGEAISARRTSCWQCCDQRIDHVMRRPEHQIGLILRSPSGDST